MEMNIHSQQGVYQVTMNGAFTFNDNAKFRSVIESVGDADLHKIVFNMERVEFLDSAALGMLLLVHDEAKKQQKSIVIQKPSAQVKRILHLARFDQFFMFE